MVAHGRLPSPAPKSQNMYRAYCTFCTIVLQFNKQSVYNNMSLPQETRTIVATVVEEILVDVIIVDKDSKLHIAKVKDCKLHTCENCKNGSVISTDHVI